jgi:putative endonuclease
VTAPHLERGALGERIVADYLTARGHRVLDRNWRGRAGELDIVTLAGGVLHFVEVKTRTGDDMGVGFGAITRAKQRRVARAAEAWLLGAPAHDGCLFSVALVTLEGEEFSVDFIADAFDA